MKAAAYHESAHVLLRWWFGHKIEFAQIGDGKGSCFVRPEPEFRQTYADVIYHFIVCACSGYACEGLSGFLDKNEWERSADRRRAFAFAGGDADLVEWSWRIAELILLSCWPRVQRLAEALEEKKFLSGEEISAILEQSKSYGAEVFASKLQ